MSASPHNHLFHFFSQSNISAPSRPFRGHLFEAGAATTGAFINNLIALLAANPRVQQKAHDEMNDAGYNRSPSPEYLASLPYLNAIVKEVMRLYPLKPFGVPHSCTEDIQVSMFEFGVLMMQQVTDRYFVFEQYNQHRIRKGTIIYVNIRGAFRDPELFEQPDKFYPERYMESDLGIRFGLVESQYEILRDLSFGVGLRKCPGQHLATTAIVSGRFAFSITISAECISTEYRRGETGLEPQLPQVPYGRGECSPICTFGNFNLLNHGILTSLRLFL